jgi:hypothetical protein
MRRKLQMFFIRMSVYIFFIGISHAAYAGEGAPPAPLAAPAQINSGGASGDTGAVVMDPMTKAVLPADSFDFGSVYEGNDVFHDFIVKNEGTSDLKIINVKSG